MQSGTNVPQIKKNTKRAFPCKQLHPGCRGKNKALFNGFVEYRFEPNNCLFIQNEPHIDKYR